MNAALEVRLRCAVAAENFADVNLTRYYFRRPTG